MNTLAQLNEAMRLLEAQLPESPDIPRAARAAGCTEHHFRRMFSYLAGMPLGEYLRSRKLALAAGLLQKGERVIDCAVLLGYESPDAFARAFAAMHGFPPSEARGADAVLKAFPPMHFELMIRGGIPMDYRVVHKASFRIVGFKKRITLQFEGINPQMEGLAGRLTPAVIAELKGLCDTEPRGMLNISADPAYGIDEAPAEGAELDEYIGVATTQTPPEGYDTLAVAAGDWAVFAVTGPFPKTVQDTWARIYAEWLPASDYQLAEGPSLLWYESPDLTNPRLKNEIWVPVAPKGPAE